MSLRPVDDELVEGIRTRSEEAFGSLYRLLASDLKSFAYGMLRDHGAAEDAVQQAFLELAKAGPTITGDGRSLRAWMYRSVRFSCLDEIRRRSRHPEVPTADLPDPGSTDDMDLPDPDLLAALDALSHRQREIVVLRYVVDASVEDIARILRTNRAAVYAASTRAERRLGRMMSRVESRGDPASPSMQRHELQQDKGRAS